MWYRFRLTDNQKKRNALSSRFRSLKEGDNVLLILFCVQPLASAEGTLHRRTYATSSFVCRRECWEPIVERWSLPQSVLAALVMAVRPLLRNALSGYWRTITCPWRCTS